jgi:hypothetical protein
MEASADEEARINNKSMSDQNEGFNTLIGKRSEASFKNTSRHTGTHVSRISGNTLLNQKGSIKKPMTTQEGRTIQKSILTPTMVSSLQRGTFSRAGGPRIKQGPNDIIEKLSSKSLYQQISDQNMHANRNNNLPRRQRVAISQSFKSA